MAPFPSIITHNYDPGRGAFQNICNLPIPDAERILCDIRASETAQLRANYLDKRLRTERWLVSERRRKIGDTYLERPLYFFLGDMADGRDPMRPQSVLMPLATFGEAMLTFTYGDSMACTPNAARLRPDPHNGICREQVYTLSEIRRAVAEQVFPWTDDRPTKDCPFIEVQVWDNRPIWRYLTRNADGQPSAVIARLLGRTRRSALDR